MTNGEKLKEVFPKGVHIGSGTWMPLPRDYMEDKNGTRKD